MRIKYSSIRSVVEPNATTPWAGPALPEKLKREAVAEGEAKKDKKKEAKEAKSETKGERAMAWLRRSR
jgi:hypothetical protein